MGMKRTTNFVMSSVDAPPDCPVLFVDVGEGFISLARLDDIERLIEETRAPLLAELDRIRAEFTAAAKWAGMQRDQFGEMAASPNGRKFFEGAAWAYSCMEATIRASLTPEDDDTKAD